MLNTMFSNDIRQTLEHFRRSVDQLFDNFYGGATQSGVTQGETKWTFTPVIETAWDDNYLHLRAVLPGVTEKDVNVTFQNNQLLIEGERKTPAGFEKNAFTQLAYGKFRGAVNLPNGLDVDRLTCRLHDGVLDIDVPIAEASKPRQIQIQTGEARRAISA